MDKSILDISEIKKLSVKDLFKKFSSSENGLSDSSVKERIEEYGYNEISEKKVSPLMKFLSYFWGPIPWMIEVAAILSAIIHHWEDFWVIFVLLLLNAVVGFWQEHKADSAIELLKQKLALKAKVLRDGKWLEIPARELVPGDVVRVRLGDIVPADIKLVDGAYLSVDESALTGESLPVEKHVSDVGYAGSIIRQGEMNALVVATAMNTFFGKTARLVAEAKTQSHFQKAVIKIGDYLIVLAIVLVAVIFIVALFRHESVLETLQFALVLTIAAIPVALPAVLTVTMAVGAMALAKRKAIVSKLAAIEEMAGMDILCSDKTGTITKNELTLAQVKPFAGFTDNDVLLFATLASKEENQDPIDNAIINKTKTLKVFDTIGAYKVKEFKPFDPVVKRTEATISDAESTSFKVTKGAPQIILSLAANKEDIAAKVEEDVDTFAAKGYRTLGVARTDKQGNWQFVGIIPLFDPPREDSAETIRIAKSMGVDVKMVTGDHVAIAKETAQKVSLGTNMMPAASILDKPDREAQRIIEEADGFAQVYPEHKYHIVELLQGKGHIVGMTGDGVNDAPALKKADTGIAVAGATDAAKSAADIVLTLPGLSVIIDAIKESRKIFQRMNSYAIYRIAETIRVLFFITLSILVFNFYPVTAIMIVLLALFNDAPIMAIAYDNVRYSNDPERWNMRVVLSMSTFLGLIGVVSSFGIFYIAQQVLHLPRETMQSFIFLKLAVAGHLTIFVTRTRGHFWSIKPSAALFWSAVVTKVLATLLAVYGWWVSPIGWKLALFVWGYALVAFVITDFAKVRAYKLVDHIGIKFHK
ncbi:MAG: plasma-membrane proton-efflux P-type ATPase [Actinobacteria bacterium]|nr:plasma-membrane proton-efflux P-type ATPase [Actinomycetota bacterium]